MQKPTRQLTIADIHGGLEGLLQCLTRSGYDKEYDQLIFTGDYVDGWSQSADYYIDDKCITQ